MALRKETPFKLSLFCDKFILAWFIVISAVWGRAVSLLFGIVFFFWGSFLTLLCLHKPPNYPKFDDNKLKNQSSPPKNK